MKKYINFILVITLMIIIFMFSNQPIEESLNVSNKVIENSNIVSNSITEEEKSNKIIKYTLPVRKLAHFTIYFVLGILVYNLLKDYKLKHLILLSILICFIYSCTDEIHQLFIPGRSGRILDVLIDTSGSIVSIIIFNYIYKLFSNKLNKQ